MSVYRVVRGQIFSAKTAKHTGVKNATIFGINILNKNGIKCRYDNHAQFTEISIQFRPVGRGGTGGYMCTPLQTEIYKQQYVK